MYKSIEKSYIVSILFKDPAFKYPFFIDKRIFLVSSFLAKFTPPFLATFCLLTAMPDRSSQSSDSCFDFLPMFNEKDFDFLSYSEQFGEEYDWISLLLEDDFVDFIIVIICQ